MLLLFELLFEPALALLPFLPELEFEFDLLPLLLLPLLLSLSSSLLSSLLLSFEFELEAFFALLDVMKFTILSTRFLANDSIGPRSEIDFSAIAGGRMKIAIFWSAFTITPWLYCLNSVPYWLSVNFVPNSLPVSSFSSEIKSRVW